MPGSSRSGLPGVRLAWQTAGVSSDNPPDLHMLNVIVGDMAASLDFYRRLGIPAPGPGDRAGAQVQLTMPGGFSLELDTAESARLWHPARARRPGPRPGRPRVRAGQPPGSR